MPWLDETGFSFQESSLPATQGAGAVAGVYLSNDHDRARSAIFIRHGWRDVRRVRTILSRDDQRTGGRTAIS